MRIPEAGGHDAVVAKQDLCVCGDFDLGPYGNDDAITHEHRAVVDGRVAGRCVNTGMLNGEGAVGGLGRRMRSVKGNHLESPEEAAGRNKETEYEKNETNDQAAHGDLTLFEHIRRERVGGSSQIGAFGGPGSAQYGGPWGIVLRFVLRQVPNLCRVRQLDLRTLGIQPPRFCDSLKECGAVQRLRRSRDAEQNLFPVLGSVSGSSADGNSRTRCAEPGSQEL